MGYLHQAIGINARYHRHQKAWQTHIDNSRQFILNAADNCERKRKVVLMGAAALHDLPVRALAEQFEEVILVDLFHLWSTRWLAFTTRNIKLEVCDLTASLANTRTGSHDISEPRAYLDDDDIDLVVSANVASQLPLIPIDWLMQVSRIEADQSDKFGKKIIKAHFDYLEQFSASVCLICDVERVTSDQTGSELSRTSALFDLPTPEHQASWTWEIAPLGEIDKNQATSHIVIASVMSQNSDI
jgi:hypothetical protein